MLKTNDWLRAVNHALVSVWKC